jgi:Tfp pilus assembly protein PilF
MATVHLARMNLELADDSARQAVDCAPREATHLATLSRIRMELGDGSAKRMVEDAYSIDADDANVNFVLGVHHEKADAKLATAFFSKASELEPSREDFRRSYARNLHVTGKRGPALEAYLKLHRVWPQDAEDIVSSADLLLAGGNPALACEGYDFLLAKASLDLLREDAIAQKLIWAWFPSSMPHVPPD